MKFIVTVPDRVPGDICAVFVRAGDGQLRRVQGRALTVAPYEETFIDYMRDAEPDWTVVAAIAGKEKAEAAKAEWHRTHKAAS